MSSVLPYVLVNVAGLTLVGGLIVVYGDDTTSRSGTGVSSLYKPFEHKPFDVSHLASSSAESIISPLSTSSSSPPVSESRGDPLGAAASATSHNNNNKNADIIVKNEDDGKPPQNKTKDNKRKKLEFSSLTTAMSEIRKTVFTTIKFNDDVQQMYDDVLRFCENFKERSNIFLEAFVRDVHPDGDVSFPYIDDETSAAKKKDDLKKAVDTLFNSTEEPKLELDDKLQLFLVETRDLHSETGQLIEAIKTDTELQKIKDQVVYPALSACLAVATLLAFHPERVQSAARLKTCNVFALFPTAVMLESRMYKSLRMWPPGENQKKWDEDNGWHTLPRTTDDWIKRYSIDFQLVKQFVENSRKCK